MGYHTARSLHDGSQPMRCYFDILRRVLIDRDGVEVADLDCAVAEARRAIAELKRDTEQDSEAEVEFGSELFLLVRVGADSFVSVIPLEDSPDGQ